ncbi:MAG: thiosulfate oxidation carrier complex protein SoxZ [Gallionella sp.]|nr:thiosulfate oxidation carrier complex protein SoxZ [Gallionella sp.]
MKIRTRKQGEAVELQLLITHPMEAGLRTDKNTGMKVPPHFIQRVTVELNGKVVVTVSTGPGVSEDPLIGFHLKDAKHGDKLKVFWSDNMGESATLEGTVDLS